jgi:dienelactone hydrolase
MKAQSFLALCVLATATLFAADAPRVLPAASLPNDVRLQPLKDLDGYFPWSPPDSKIAWENRAAALKMQMRVALGIWPEPTRTPLNAVVHGKIERDGYTVEKVYFESMPGLFHTGNLYRPKGMPGKHPAVIVTHGHWVDARFWEKDAAALKKEIEAGQERSVIGGRTIFQSIGVQLARMGCIAFVSDMLGNSDSQQFSQEFAHRFAKQRPEMISPMPGQWGLFSPQAETYGQSIMGIQTWNNVRALDFLTSLDDVDATRLAVTGASGGGTQSMLLAALDPRLAVAVPCVMVSTAMQGGCTCENASLLRVGTGNIEFAALFAPKPMGMTTAHDWTQHMSEKGFPDLAQHWKNLGAPDSVQLFNHPDFPHNYNLVTREHIYGFLNTHFRLGLGGDRLKERDYEPLTRGQLSVWDAQHPAPAGGAEFEKKLLRWWSDDSDKTLVADFEKTARPALDAIFARTLASEKAVMDRSTFKKEDRGDWWLLRGVVDNEARHEAVPCLFFHPKKWNGRTVIWLNEKGKAALLDGDQPNADVTRLLAAGVSVTAPDLLMQGEFLFDGQSDNPVRKVKNPREAACFTFGYNHSLFVQRTHDVLTLLAFVRDHEHHSMHVALLALDKTAAIAAAARALSDGFVNRAVLDTQGVRLIDADSIYSPWFQPGAAKFGDASGLLRLGKGALWVKSDAAGRRQTAIEAVLAD